VSDRTVHARGPYGAEVARYDRAGKWYFEEPDGRRKKVSLQMAAYVAIDLELEGGTIFFDRPGGRQFDHRIRSMPF
jgi:hypothetical protein